MQFYCRQCVLSRLCRPDPLGDLRRVELCARVPERLTRTRKKEKKLGIVRHAVLRDELRLCLAVDSSHAHRRRRLRELSRELRELRLECLALRAPWDVEVE